RRPGPLPQPFSSRLPVLGDSPGLGGSRRESFRRLHFEGEETSLSHTANHSTPRLISSAMHQVDRSSPETTPLASVLETPNPCPQRGGTSLMTTNAPTANCEHRLFFPQLSGPPEARW